MKQNYDLSHTRNYPRLNSRSATNSHSSLTLSKFQFEKPSNILWKQPMKKVTSSENILEQSDTCMFIDEPQSKALNFVDAECQTDTFTCIASTLLKQNQELLFELKSLRSEVACIKAAVFEINKAHVEPFSPPAPLPKEKENTGSFNQYRPPLPYHRNSKSINFS